MKLTETASYDELQKYKIVRLTHATDLKFDKFKEKVSGVLVDKKTLTKESLEQLAKNTEFMAPNATHVFIGDSKSVMEVNSRGLYEPRREEHNVDLYSVAYCVLFHY